MIARSNTLGGLARNVNRPGDELALCRRIAAGERQLFGEIIDRYGSLVAGVVASQGVAAADVEDLAQLVFINAYKGLAGFRGDAKLSSWLYRIAVNTSRQHLKRQALRPTPYSVEEALETGRQPADQRQQAPDYVVRNRALAAALNRLPDSMRTALGLYYFEELSYEEIAEAMQMKLNTVRTQIYRGKQRLAQLLDEETLTD